ncbi:rhodanese-like domain-containing protein [Flagellimonas allohymeniacidonis]|uniref:Rhodanese-like domain-containing protein n=1 Tax=Flagellimonas allohymeniacidonis TaxID=2517819 RepID=A0A4Q8QG34_9FLAO|nr:rhodanese-like domain-containing protein [Allomuricauda hymeniacidonis]TAI47309.1 rhodanese-like domain-containing protein [Allomuricauda hymeniacidonis]
MRTIFKPVLAVALFLQFFGCQPKKEGSIKKIDKQTVMAEVVGKDVQLLDVRTPAEFTAGHIDGAVNFNIKDKETFLKQISALEKDEPVYLYCKKGGRSNSAAQLLRKEGFQNILDYSGGYDDWTRD